ncbi:MAG: hypothetical protein ABIP74_02090 [Candidatus Saccharimonas sp.]
MSTRLARHDGTISDSAENNVESIPAHFDRESLEGLGFEVLDPQPAGYQPRTTSFVRVRLPEGWSLVQSPHAGVRHIIDELGIRRVTLTDNGQSWDRYVSTAILKQGVDISRRLCYGDDDLETVKWSSLTAEEQSEVKEGLRYYVAEGEEAPHVYAKTAATATDWLARIEALGPTTPS